MYGSTDVNSCTHPLLHSHTNSHTHSYSHSHTLSHTDFHARTQPNAGRQPDPHLSARWR